MIEFTESEKELFVKASSNTIAYKEHLKYFDEILARAKNKAENFIVPDKDFAEAYDITYLPNRQRFSMGLGEGLAFQAECKTYKTTEKDKIKANCLHYNKIYKKDGRVVKIENYFDGKTDHSCFLAYYEDHYRYLFSIDAHKVGNWTFITRFENNRVVEECTISGNTLAYEKYSGFSENRVDYYSAFYVPYSYCIMQGEVIGYFELPSLNFVTTSSYSWNDIYKKIIEMRKIP